METETDFIPGEDLLNKINEFNEEKQPLNLLEILSQSFNEEELALIRKKIFSPSRLILGQNKLSDFRDFQGELPELLEQLNFIYKSLNSYNDETLSRLIAYLRDKETGELTEIISYLPLNPFLPNLIELLATMLENGDLNNGSVLDNEILFQGFKRVFEPRLQKTIFSLLLYQYNLDKDLIQLKTSAWKVLNTSGRMAEAALILDSIHKSNIRLRKAKELLLQEKLELNLNSEINTALPLTLREPEDVLFPVYKAYFKLSQNPQLNLEKFFSMEYHIDLSPVKTLSQQLMTYKPGLTGETVTSRLNTLNNAGYMSKTAIVDSVTREAFANTNFSFKSFPDEMRETVFSIMGYGRQKAWPVEETAADLIITALTQLPFKSLNDFKLASYCLGRELIAGVVRVKYKTDDVIKGIAAGLAHININKEIKEKGIFRNKKIFITCFEFMFYGIWDTTLELYPNLMTAEKSISMLCQDLKKELNLLEINNYEKILAGLHHEHQEKPL